MRGSIVKRTSKDDPRRPLYYVVYRVGGRQKWEAAGLNKKDAEAKLAEVVRRINMGGYTLSHKITFETIARQFLDEKKASRKLGTYLDYCTTVGNPPEPKGFMLPHFGPSKLTAITTDQVSRFREKLAQRLKPGYVNKIIKHLGTVFEFAKRKGHILINPVEGIERLSEPHREAMIYTPSQVAKLLQHCEEPHKTMFLMAFFTGLRPGELFGLRWSDVDFEASRLIIRRNVMFAPGTHAQKDGSRWHFQSPKTKRGFRSVDMSPMVKRALEIHKLNILGKANPHNLVFFTEAGTPHDSLNIIRRYFKPAQEAVGLLEIRFYDARHTFASMLIELGQSPKYIQEQMGHSSIQITMDVYGHLFPSSQSRIDDRFDKLIFSTDNEPDKHQTSQKTS